MNAALYHHGIGSLKDTFTDAQAIAMTGRWIKLDGIRVAGAFVAALRALTLPWPTDVVAKDPPVVRALLALALVGVASFVV